MSHKKLNYEAIIEDSFIDSLKKLGYTYRGDIKDKKSLEDNFREKFNQLNQVKLTDKEFEKLLSEIVNKDVFTNSKTLRGRMDFIREDGTPLNYKLLNNKDWCKNEFEVINQLKINTHSSYQCYDVIILINGLPVVQIELKRNGINTKNAMVQINNYKNDKGNGYTNSLMCFMQLFIVSNSSNTYYFANNNSEFFNFGEKEQYLPCYEHADKNNDKICDLDDFTRDFLNKCKLAEIIGRYMVLVETERKVLIMRPYQIYAVQSIVDCINNNSGNGYIWHTTGSGKTLTSFKAATLLKDNENIHKCLFVVDRKDLDKQTKDEFNKFQENCVGDNENTKQLVDKLLSENWDDKIIVTTIQKLGVALRSKGEFKKSLETLQDKKIVFMFDECHRSQFGENHQAIKNFFKNHQLFGFTGTPIFDENANIKTAYEDTESYKTTESIFEKKLHSYTIGNAIEDKNVLAFNVEHYANKFNIDTQPNKKSIVKTILEKHNKATENKTFNSILACNSISDAIDFYKIFKEEQKDKSISEKLNIACVFSPPPSKKNEDTEKYSEDCANEKLEYRHTEEENDRKKQELENIIKDYNEQYGTSCCLSQFSQYYTDIQRRVKDHNIRLKDSNNHENKIDIVIVVDMMLTGFDAKYLNTLYVAKNLKYHGLIQAFSRTNRILNHKKPFGSILDFKNKEEVIKEAILLFSDKNEKLSKVWFTESLEDTIAMFEDKMKEIKNFMNLYDLQLNSNGIANLKGREAKINFVEKMRQLTRTKTKLERHTDINEEQKARIQEILPDDLEFSLRQKYLETVQDLKQSQYQKYKSAETIDNEKEQSHLGNSDIKQEENDFNPDEDLILYSNYQIDYDYIFELMASSYENEVKFKGSKEKFLKYINSYSNFMEDKEDLTAYVHSLSLNTPLTYESIKEGFYEFKDSKNNEEIESIALKFSIEKEKLKAFIDITITRMVFEDNNLEDLFSHLNLNMFDIDDKKTALMKDLLPLLKKLTNGKTISGINIYKEN